MLTKNAAADRGPEPDPYRSYRVHYRGLMGDAATALRKAARLVGRR